MGEVIFCRCGREIKGVPELRAKNQELTKALRLAYEAMNYLGDILNKHDMVQPEDEVVTKEAFEIVSKIIGLSKPCSKKG